MLSGNVARSAPFVCAHNNKRAHKLHSNKCSDWPAESCLHLTVNDNVDDQNNSPTSSLAFLSFRGNEMNKSLIYRFTQLFDHFLVSLKNKQKRKHTNKIKKASK